MASDRWNAPRVVHDYLFVDLDIVWDVTTNDLPGLVETLGPTRKSLNSLSAEAGTTRRRAAQQAP